MFEKTKKQKKRHVVLAALIAAMSCGLVSRAETLPGERTASAVTVMEELNTSDAGLPAAFPAVSGNDSTPRKSRSASAEGYLPYEGAKYKLSFSQKTDGAGKAYITITGVIEPEEELKDWGRLVIPEKINEIPVTGIESNAFKGCSGLTGELVIPSSVTKIGSYAFFGCSGLTGNLIIPSGVKEIGSDAFNSCSGLTGVTISSGVTRIGSYAFFYCSGLTGKLVIPSSVTTIDASAFQGCKGLTGELVIPERVTEIGDSAFYGCSGLTGKLVIPEGVTKIGDSAFSGCSGMTGVKISSGVKEIGSDAFKGCSGLTGELVIPSGVTSIGESAFEGCSGLTGKLVIPEGITSINSYAFKGCKGLTGVTIPSGVTSIGESAFYNCNGLTGELVIPEGVTSIGRFAFNNCRGLTGKLVIPKGVTEISFCAFSGCSGLTGELVIPSGVTSISYGAFKGCSGLTGELVIPSGVTSIGESAFYDCSGLTGELVIPEGVTSIGKNAFRNCSGLTGDLVISKNVTSWGEAAFDGCNFRNLTIGAANIPNHAFSGSYGDSASCNFDGKLTLQETVTSIGEYAFRNCSGLTGELVIPEGVTSIGKYAFKFCRGLTGELVIPEGVTDIGEQAFYGCSGLTGELVIPEGVTGIGEKAFYDCTNLEDVTIPESVETIGRDAFRDCLIYGYSGSAAEKYADGSNGCTFIPIPEITEHKVKSVQELEKALGSYRHIILADGIYNTKLDLSHMVSVTIEAEHPGKVEFLVNNTLDPVVYMEKSRDIRITGCILGHDTGKKEQEKNEGACGGSLGTGYVIQADHSRDIIVQNCDLYGCGLEGLHCLESRDITVDSCVIRDCERCVTSGGRNVTFKNCIISGNGYKESEAKYYAALDGTNNIYRNCTFMNNYSAKLFSGKGTDNFNKSIVSCTFYDNAWDGKTPKAYGVCLNGITWQVQGKTLKIGYPIKPDSTNVIPSKTGKVLDYSDSSLPWRLYMDLSPDVAEGVEYNFPIETVKEYTITFNGNGATGGKMNPLTKCAYGTEYTLTANGFSRTGYSFAGWNTQANGSGKAYADQAKVKDLTAADGGSVTLFAQWKANTYTIKFQKNGATSGSMASLTGRSYDKSYILPANAFKRTGYSFQGWNTKKDGTGKTYKNMDSVKNLTAQNGATVTLYAQWKAKTYTIKFHKNGGTGGSMASLTNCSYGKSYKLSANKFKRTGYTFTGWNTKKDGTGKTYKDKASVKNLTDRKGKTVTLYAQWKKNITYQIKFDGNGATSGKMSTLKKCKSGKSYKLPANQFKKKGYTFAGWNTKKNGSGKSYKNKASVKNLTTKNGKTVTLYAQWKPVTYTVKFDGNKASSGKMKDIKNCKYGKSFKLPKAVFKRKGYTFKGWNTKKDGSGKAYKNMEEVKNLTSKNGKTIVLYAQWKKKK